MKESPDFGNQKSISDNLHSIVDVLKSNVNHNVAKVVSKKELAALSDQMKVIELLKDQLTEKCSSNSDDLKKHSEMIAEISYGLLRISTSIETLKTLTDQMQGQAVLDTAATFYFSGCGAENAEL